MIMTEPIDPTTNLTSPQRAQIASLNRSNQPITRTHPIDAAVARERASARTNGIALAATLGWCAASMVYLAPRGKSVGPVLLLLACIFIGPWTFGVLNLAVWIF